MKEQLISWLKEQQPILDKIIFEAANEYYQQNKSKENFEFELSECQKESFNLVNQEDLCYDRLNTAFCYSLWYHGRRVNTFLSYFADSLLNSGQDNIEIFDLGAGTGAIQWALGLVYSGMQALGIKTPNLKIINVDSSPFMLSYNEKYLWNHFKRKYPLCSEPNFSTSYSLNAWTNPDNIQLTNPWIASSYLFDMSDNQEEIAKGFNELVDTFRPTNLLLLTSTQTNKVTFLNKILATLKDKDFITSGLHTKEKGNLLFSGTLPIVSKFRADLAKQFNANGLGRIATWDDSFMGLTLTKRQAVLTLNSSLKLYVVSEKDRTKIRLSKDQIEASKHVESPTIITGPAGCGKSVVLTERIKNLVELRNYDPKLRILVTTFNKDLINYLGDWLEQLLEKSVKRTNVPKEKISYFWFQGATKRNIDVLHFDILPTRLNLVSPIEINHKIKPNDFGGDYEGFHHDKIQEIAENHLANSKLNRRDYLSVLDSNFLLDEYHRIIYGNQCLKYKQYKDIERKGRGIPKLGYNSAKRKFVWEVLTKYVKYLKQEKMDSFTLRRFRLLQNLKKHPLSDEQKFDYIYVDELQDCTDADYEIFYSLLKNVSNIVLTGDLAQSIHLGTSSKVPRSEGMKNFQKKPLEGSYRLPFRISECISRVSDKINQKRKKNENNESGNIINPFKGSPPGARPIIFYASTIRDIKIKIQSIFNTYKIYGFDTISIFERDTDLCRIVNEIGIKATEETILKAKGLEKQCVLWSTRTPINTEKEVDEYIYTILTRTSSTLIIALSDKISQPYIEILKVLSTNRIIFFDKVSKDKYFEFCQKKESDLIDEEDTSATVSEHEEPEDEMAN